MAKTSVRARVAVLAALLVFAVLTLAGCGGGSTGKPALGPGTLTAAGTAPDPADLVRRAGATVDVDSDDSGIRPVSWRSVDGTFPGSTESITVTTYDSNASRDVGRRVGAGLDPDSTSKFIIGDRYVADVTPVEKAPPPDSFPVPVTTIASRISGHIEPLTP